MRTFQVDDRTFSGYLAGPAHGSGPSVLVLHAWWGLTEPFRQVCDRLAVEGFVALAPDLYRGKTTASVEEAEALVGALIRMRSGYEATSQQQCSSCANTIRHS